MAPLFVSIFESVARRSVFFRSDLSFRPDRKIERKLSKKPYFFPFLFGFSLASVLGEDFRELLNLRFRSRLDLTLPMQETLGEDGSTSPDSDFPTETLRFGNSLMLLGLLWLRRFLASTKEVFCGLGKPMMVEALDLKLREKRWELLLELMAGFRFVELLLLALVDSLRS